ncbi:U7 snRNA-associated Sm-like protein LSm10 [Menidia menidia]
MATPSLRERGLAQGSLVLLLQGLQGHVTTVELRDEGAARGRLLSVDAFMNVRLQDVLFRDRGGRSTHLQDLFVTGRNVRYVHIPDQVDVLQTIREQLDQNQRVRSFGSEGGGRKEFSKRR